MERGIFTKLPKDVCRERFSSLPALPAPDACFLGCYHAGEGAEEIGFSGVPQEAFDRFFASLAGTGVFPIRDRSIAGNRFSVCRISSRLLFLSYYPKEREGTLRLVATPDGWLPPEDESPAETLCPVTFTQIGRAPDFKLPFGMGYIARTMDGRFLIIDGGPGNEDDERRLLEFLLRNNPRAGEKPRLIWLITHAHMDHMQLANRFLDRFHGEVTVECVGYNFPDFETLECKHEEAGKAASLALIRRFRELIAQHYPNATEWILHAGQTFSLPGCRVTVLFTQEDHWPEPFKWINYTGAVFRLEFPGNRAALILGDIEHQCNVRLAEVFGDALRSDIVQVSHHGYSGGNQRLYEVADPKICFWPIDEYRYMNDPRRLGEHPDCLCNKYLREKPDCENYHSSNTVTVTFPELRVTVGGLG